MAAATLPVYARIMFDSYSQKRDSAILRTDMESGPPRQAKIRSRVMLTRTVRIVIESLANFQLFETWFKDDINYGADFFNMRDPVSKATIEARFVGGEYVSRPLTGTLTLWQIDASIESWG